MKFHRVKNLIYKYITLVRYNKMKNLVIIIVLSLSLLLVFKQLTNNANFMHFYYMIFSKPDDLKKTIILEDFSFDKKGEQKLYKLNFKHVAMYDISIIDKNEKIPIGFQFKGKIRLDFYHKDKIVDSKLIETVEEMAYSKKSMKYYKSILLHTFGIPIKGEKEDLSVKVTVIEPDKKLSECCSELQLCISVSYRI